MPADDPGGGFLEIDVASGQEPCDLHGIQPVGSAHLVHRDQSCCVRTFVLALSKSRRSSFRIADLDEGISQRVLERPVRDREIAPMALSSSGTADFVTDPAQCLGRCSPVMKC